MDDIKRRMCPFVRELLGLESVSEINILEHERKGEVFNHAEFKSFFPLKVICSISIECLFGWLFHG